MSPDTITVAMPYWHTPATIARAAESILAQTHTALRLVVVNDGDTETPPWPTLAHIADPRLVRFDLTVNRGRYFADAVTLAACDTPWFAICDADDWAEPGWLEASIREANHGGLDAVYAPQWVHAGEAQPGHLEPVGAFDRHRRHLVHVAHHAALYRTSALRAIGGPHPGFRIGYDTLMAHLMALTGRAGALDRPFYHRVIRAGSLTTSPATGYGSACRVGNAARLQALYDACRAARSAAPAIADMPAQMRAAVDAEAARLRKDMA